MKAIWYMDMISQILQKDIHFSFKKTCRFHSWKATTRNNDASWVASNPALKSCLIICFLRPLLGTHYPCLGFPGSRFWDGDEHVGGFLGGEGSRVGQRMKSSWMQSQGNVSVSPAGSSEDGMILQSSPELGWEGWAPFHSFIDHWMWAAGRRALFS